MKHPRFKSQYEADNYVLGLARSLQRLNDKLAHRTYISPTAIFNDKAKVLCKAYREAKGRQAKINACYDCKLEKCVVGDGNYE